MGTHDSQTLKSEADILARQSRPQRNSTWVPKTRDWRYATGVIQHNDHEDTPKTRSVWDTLDFDYQAACSKSVSGEVLNRSRSGTGSELGIAETTEVEHISNHTVSDAPIQSPKAIAPPQGPYRPMELRKRYWRQVTKFTRSGDNAGEDGQASYEVTGLVVRFRFTRKNRALVKEILEGRVHLPPPISSLEPSRSPPVKQNPVILTSSPSTPAAARTAETMRTPHTLDSIESLYTFPLFQRTWVDETKDFNAKLVRSTLRSPDMEVGNLGTNYEWYDNAVPADAMFPPGVPLSAKEIQAFYPHHVRWKGVMVRLTKNDYRGGDILGMQNYFRGAPNHHTSPTCMNNYQRDTVKSSLPGFKTASYKGKSDRDLRVDHLAPGPYIESTRKGFSLPTFDDLVRGLHRLPSGLDARGLTQCMSWYLNIRNSFTPQLDLNVMHVQSLIRALREPLKPFGPQILDRNALQEWRSKGTFETVEIERKELQRGEPFVVTEQQRRTQMRLDLDKDDVSMKLTLPVRHILTFPFMALHGVMAEALKLGIDKAETRKAARKGDDFKDSLQPKWAAKAAGEDDMESADAQHEDEATSNNTPVQIESDEPKKPYRIPKRPRSVQRELLPAPKKLHTPSGASFAPGSHSYTPAPAPSYSRVPPHIQNGGYLSRSWNTSAPSSAYAPQPLAQDSVYGRRSFTTRQLDLQRGGGRHDMSPSLPSRQYNHRSASYDQGGHINPRYGGDYYGYVYRR